ncbi:hypothetical protein DH2020_047012 [Rehmannia glutinosa]|uniref:Uncharacterized protein n=1 Tax=Rehmannia glutinosa TaxID=99300 RepID=A0ABR0UA56_REHGL
MAGTMSFGLKFSPSKSHNLVAFADDADWASDLDDRRSTFRFCVFTGNNLISWSSKKQTKVSRSSTEAEYHSLAHAICDILWLQSLFNELKVPETQSPIIWVDNQSSISLANNPVHHSQTKYFELDLHFIRDKVLQKIVRVQHVPSLNQIANIITKPLSGQFFVRLRNQLSVLPHTSLKLRGHNRDKTLDHNILTSQKEKEMERTDAGVVVVKPKPKKGVTSKAIDWLECSFVKMMHDPKKPLHYLSGNFAPVDETPPLTDLPVKGHLPVSVTPGQFFL